MPTSAKLLHGPANDSHVRYRQQSRSCSTKTVLTSFCLGKPSTCSLLMARMRVDLSGTVGPEETVTLTTLEAEMGLVQKNLSTVGQVECAVAEILALLLIWLGLSLICSAGGGALAESLGDGLGVLLADNGGDVGTECSGSS